MRKTYILDTCVLVHHPEAYLSFPDSLVVLPITVLDELDKLKKKNDEAGKKARAVCRLLDQVTEDKNGQDILLENGSYLRLDTFDYQKEINIGDPLYGDNRILAAAICYDQKCKASGEFEAVFVTRDINAKVRARSFGVKTIGYNKDEQNSEAPFSGVFHMESDDALEYLYENSYIDPDEFEEFPELYPNEYLVVHSENGDGVAIARNYDGNIKLIKNKYPWDLSPKNPEQACAIDLLMDPSVSLVTIIGSAGGGKSLISLAACLEMVLNKNMYDKICIYRPMHAVGADIGFLPGDQKEKLAPWMEPIYDAAEVLLKTEKTNKRAKFSNKETWREDFDMYVEKGQIELNAMTYVRGRSLPRSIILIDEAQNISKHDIKTLLTRAGEGTKIILTGDIEQIDNPALDATNNGLTYVLEKFKDYKIAGHVTLVKGERSELATIAAEIL